MNVKCYDYGESVADRYTVVYMDHYYPATDTYMAFGCDEWPTHPLGIGQHCECLPGPHLGKEIPFSELPESVQNFVTRELTQ
jgi:hypothetical protein